jgi:hypothetical protein
MVLANEQLRHGEVLGKVNTGGCGVWCGSGKRCTQNKGGATRGATLAKEAHSHANQLAEGYFLKGIFGQVFQSLIDPPAGTQQMAMSSEKYEHQNGGYSRSEDEIIEHNCTCRCQ